MSTWDKLSMADRAKYIKLAVQNGVTSLGDIRDTYNRYAEGGYYNAGRMVDAIYESATGVENLGEPDHHYDFTQTEEWADAHGYYPDERGHRDDRVKKPAHPTHPSKGKWNGLNEFQLTDLGMKDPNYIMFGMADGGQDPQATLTYNGSTVLPEFTVTPNGNYIHNSYDNLNIRLKRNGGKLNSNKYGDGSWIQSIMDGTLWDEWKSARANKEVVQGQPAPGNPIVSNKNLNKTEGKSSKETFLYNGNTVYRDLDNNYYDAKGNKLVDSKNDLLYTYYKQLRDSLKSGTDPLRYFRYYTDNYRHLQNSRIKAAKAASFIDPLNERIPISQGKSKGVSAPKALIDSMIAHKPANADIYTGLGMLSQETDFYNKRNHGFAGNSLGATNNERYVLPDQTFHRALSYAIRKQYRNTDKKEGLTEENYVKKYLNEDNISKNKEVLNYVNKILAEDLNSYPRFKGYIQEDLKPAPNFWDHTWNELLSGNYNPGDRDYNNKVNKEANALKRDPKLSEYVRKALKSSKSK